MWLITKLLLFSGVLHMHAHLDAETFKAGYPLSDALAFTGIK